MIYPIVAYGDPVLKLKAKEIPLDFPGLRKLVEDMYETMYNADGVGLAAPQVGLSIRLFITDGAAFEDEDVQSFRQVFINPVILSEEGEPWQFSEGCLSIPDIRENVSRKETVRIEFYDLELKKRNETYSGLAARIIQHEYDHLEGILFVDYLPFLKKRILKGKLNDIAKGKVEVKYKMKFPLLK